MAARRAHFLVRLTPVAYLLIAEGLVPLEGRAEFDRGHLCPRVHGTRAAVALSDRHTGE
jgi:hypothetical protein